jgi:hypothetical protein
MYIASNCRVAPPKRDFTSIFQYNNFTRVAPPKRDFTSIFQYNNFTFIMTEWAEPRDFREWAKRVFALRPILLLMMVSCIFILELRFD